MKITLQILIAYALVLTPFPLAADEAQVSRRQKVYKTVGEVQLKANIYELEKSQARKRPAIVFFFGGGWRSGSVNQFRYQSEYLARQGMVAIVPDYRVYNRQMASVVDCVSDAKSAIRWVRANARQLGIDPQRIAAGGGSAGGHLAAATALLPGLDQEGENRRVSSEPNALLLFNPALDLRREAFPATFPETRYKELSSRFGGPVEIISPQHHLRPKLPPTIIFHGRADTTIPFATVERFCAATKTHGNRCQLVGYDNAAHGFFNYGRSGNTAFINTLEHCHTFLAGLGYLEGEPNVKSFVASLSKQE